MSKQMQKEKSRGELRLQRSRQIRQRIHLLTVKTRSWSTPNLPEQTGRLANNNEVNARMGAGKRKKTNTRKSCASYRHHGGYGPANKYKPHDRRQIEKLKQQLTESDEEGRKTYGH